MSARRPVILDELYHVYLGKFWNISDPCKTSYTFGPCIIFWSLDNSPLYILTYWQHYI